MIGVTLIAAAFGILIFILLSFILLRGIGSSEVEVLTAPLVMRLGRRGGPNLAKQLEWAKIPYFNTPEAWNAFKLFLPFVGLAAGFFIGSAGGNMGLGILTGAICAAMGFFYPRVTLSGRLKRRQALIARDVPRFLGAFARARAVQPTVESLLEVSAAAEAERARRRLAASGGDGAGTRRRSVNPYGSALWDALGSLIRNRESGLVVQKADRFNPDPMIAFAITCDDPEIDRFVEMLRDALVGGRELAVDAVERLISQMNERRVEATKREAVAAQARATFILVTFNLPLLIGATTVPPIVGALFFR